jgi:hypothetical protein
MASEKLLEKKVESASLGRVSSFTRKYKMVRDSLDFCFEILDDCERCVRK